jgi:hypothetical protein
MDKTAHIFNEMKGTFNITKGHPEIYVGLHIMRDRLTKTIHIDQDRYIEKILVKFGFQDATPMTILANPHSSLDLLFAQGEQDDTHFPYGNCTSNLQFAS